jgi:hypothetical protein
MQAKEMDGCCALRVLFDLHCLGELEEWGKKEAKGFDTVCTSGGYTEGDSCTATVLTLSSEVGRAHLNRQIKFVTSKGYKLLGQWKSENGDTIYLYGSKEFKMPARRGKK